MLDRLFGRGRLQQRHLQGRLQVRFDVPQWRLRHDQLPDRDRRGEVHDRRDDGGPLPFVPVGLHEVLTRSTTLFLRP